MRQLAFELPDFFRKLRRERVWYRKSQMILGYLPAIFGANQHTSTSACAVARAIQDLVEPGAVTRGCQIDVA